MLRVVIDSPQLSVDVFFDDKQSSSGTNGNRSQRNSLLFLNNVHLMQVRNMSAEATATLHVRNVVELLKLLLSDEVGNIPLQGDYHLLQEYSAHYATG